VVPRRAWLPWILVLLAPPPLPAQSFCEAVTADTLVNPTVLGNGTPGSVTTAALQGALNAGGHIRFNLGPSPATIVLTATLTIDRAVVLDGGGLVTLSGGDARRIVQITNTQNQFYAITLQNLAFADANTPTGRGAAIYKASGGPWQAVSLKLVNDTFRDNDAMLTGQDDGGGALYATGMDHVRIATTTFTNNRGSNGGAVYSLGSKRVTIVDSVFAGNQATGTGGNPGNGGNAGALGVDGADRLLDVCRTRFLGNTSNAFGAGFFSVMYDATSRSRFEDVTFDGNRQLSTSQHTGGAYVQGGPFAFERVSFLRNEANGYGGLFVGPGASGTIRNGTFVANVARQGLGAAMALTASSPVTIVNTTIANNVSTAAFAAGISIGSPNQLRLTNVILANNTGGNRFVNWNIQNAAAQDGGGNMQWPATRPNGGGAETPATPGTTFADPMLAAAAAANGGAVPTIALASTSPARDTGVATAEVPATDARGASRNGPPDRGSYEVGVAISIGDASVTEGSGGTVVMSFPVTLSTTSATTVTVDFATADGTAKAPADYTATSGVVTFLPGETSKTIPVTINGDLLDEPDETFFVNLSNPTGGAVISVRPRRSRTGRARPK
jgi:Calx-beta domain/Right handed beta helix region